MRRHTVASVALLLTLPPLPTMAQWMTYVGRNVDTGERLGLGARVVTENEDPRLSILCTPDGLTATFDTGIAVPPEQAIDQLPKALLIGADGGQLDPFPASLETFNRSERTEMRLRLDASEAQGLAEYVLGTAATLRVAYTLNGQDVFADFSNASATVTIGAVLSECQGRNAKTK